MRWVQTLFAQALPREQVLNASVYGGPEFGSCVSFSQVYPEVSGDQTSLLVSHLLLKFVCSYIAQ